MSCVVRSVQRRIGQEVWAGRLLPGARCRRKATRGAGSNGRARPGGRAGAAQHRIDEQRPVLARGLLEPAGQGEDRRLEDIRLAHQPGGMRHAAARPGDLHFVGVMGVVEQEVVVHVAQHPAAEGEHAGVRGAGQAPGQDPVLRRVCGGQALGHPATKGIRHFADELRALVVPVHVLDQCPEQGVAGAVAEGLEPVAAVVAAQGQRDELGGCVGPELESLAADALVELEVVALEGGQERLECVRRAKLTGRFGAK